MKKFLQDPRVLYFATLVLLLLPNIGLSVTEPMTLSDRVTNLLLPGGLYILLLTISRNPARNFWISFLLVFLSAFQIVLLYLFGGSIIAVDMFLNLVTTNPSEVEELLGSLLPAVIGVVVVYVPVIVLAVVKTRTAGYELTRRFRSLARRFGVAVTLAGCVSLTVSCLTGEDVRQGRYRVADSLYPVNVFYNIYLAGERTALSSAREDKTSSFNFEAGATHRPDSLREVYVMVIGETARAENFGIYGYERETTPGLSSTPGVIAFPEAYTQSNTTHKSVPMLLSAASAVDFDRVYDQKGILSAFSEAGFHTAFISNQRPNHSFIDLLGQEADEWYFLKEEAQGSENIYDISLVEALDSLMKSRRDQNLFVVLHTYGSHFRYNERYPSSMRRWSPDMPDDAVASNREALLNAYDNTILYTDRVLTDIIERLAAEGGCSALLYASDHGENIFDDDRNLFLHASPRPSAHELHVPLIAWTSDRHRALYPEVTRAMESNRARRVITSASMFHSMLGLGGIATDHYADSLSVTSGQLADLPYYYLSDRNIPVPIERIVRK